jgi:solute:Na+ symporter, SSS family
MLLIFIILYFLATLAIGFYASRKVQTAGDFINTGRNLHPAINTAALFALWFGSETIFGASAQFAEHGLIGVIEDPLGGVLCLLLVGFFFSRKLYQLNIYTIGDLFRKHYGPKVEMLSALLMIFSFLGYAAAQIVALGLLVHTLLGIHLSAGMLFSVSIVVLYTFKGGMWAVSITDFIQSILIVIGLIAITWFVTDQIGGFRNVLDKLTPEQTRFLPKSDYTSWLNWIAAWMVLGFGSIASQDIFQRINSARSEKAAYYSTIFGALFYLLFAMLPLYLILAIQAIEPSILQGDLQLALPQLVLKKMPVFIQVLFFGSLLSAIMSTCSGALLAPASLLSENLIKPMLKNSTKEYSLLKMTRLSVILIGILSYLIALGSQDIFALVSEASVIGLVTIFVPFVAALFSNHTNAIAAAGSMMLGSVGYIIFRVFPISDINPLLYGLLASITGLMIGHLIHNLIFKSSGFENGR